MTEELSTLELDVLRASANQPVNLPYRDRWREIADATSRLRSLGLVKTGFDDDQPTAWATDAGLAALSEKGRE